MVVEIGGGEGGTGTVGVLQYIFESAKNSLEFRQGYVLLTHLAIRNLFSFLVHQIQVTQGGPLPVVLTPSPTRLGTGGGRGAAPYGASVGYRVYLTISNPQCCESGSGRIRNF
jgi:hypothetical protein